MQLHGTVVSHSILQVLAKVGAAGKIICQWGRITHALPSYTVDRLRRYETGGRATQVTARKNVVRHQYSSVSDQFNFHGHERISVATIQGEKKVSGQWWPAFSGMNEIVYSAIAAEDHLVRRSELGKAQTNQNDELFVQNAAYCSGSFRLFRVSNAAMSSRVITGKSFRNG